MRRRRVDFEAELDATVGRWRVKPKAFVYVCGCLGGGSKIGVTDDVFRRMSRLVRGRDELRATELAFLRLYERDVALDIEDAVRPLLVAHGHFRTQTTRTDYYRCAPSVSAESVVQAEREIHAWPRAEYNFDAIPLWEPDPYMKPRPAPPREPIEFRCI